MNLKGIIILAFLANWNLAFSQLTYEYDTLSITDRIFGKVDSTDVRSGVLPTTFDGGIGYLSESGFSLGRLNHDFGSLRFDQSSSPRQLKFSALPYLGFGYSFGAQGTQFIRAEYVQAFTDSLVLNIDYAANIGNGFLRNADFRSNRVNLNLEWKAKRYSMKLDASYFSDSLSHTDGIEIDTFVLESFGLIFSPTRKSNAASANKFARAEITNYFQLNSDSIRHIGLLTKHIYDLKYRAYHEFSDTLATLYDQINIDSTTTYDRSNLARIQNSAGVYYSNKKQYIDARLGHRYWSNLNLGNDFDTTEIDLSSNLRWKFGSIYLSNYLNVNLYGGFGALTENANLEYRRAKLKISGNLSLDRAAPTPMKRSYFANNYAYALTDVQLEDRFSIGGKGEYLLRGDSILVGASINSLAIRNAYIFEDTIWNQTGTLNALQLDVYGQFQLGKFHVHPRIIYSAEQTNYLPQFQSYARVYFKSTVFKARKLLLLIGVDGSYISAFQPRNYLPSMDAFTWNQNQPSTKGMVNAHFFTTIEISTFRFFVRYENIGYFWNEKTTLEVNGYPIAAQRVRVGLTWSFFN